MLLLIWFGCNMAGLDANVTHSLMLLYVTFLICSLYSIKHNPDKHPVLKDILFAIYEGLLSAIVGNSRISAASRKYGVDYDKARLICDLEDKIDSLKKEDK